MVKLKAEGWSNLFLQGEHGRKMCKTEITQFYINATSTSTSIRNITQTTKDFIGKVNQAAILASLGGSNALIQRLRNELVRKDVEISQMHVAHHDVVLLLHGKYEIEREDLQTQITALQSALDKGKETNSVNLKGLYELLK
ncbi:hypothetical protein HAX54_050125 [Datura stramonium]|uniref:Uncharacterized protein n=1 Tax=Datura stramonium TaxID=4076 RepID=A0ABS8WNP1_DATST|nr:hypothetical protein [Datura stramonium]